MGRIADSAQSNIPITWDALLRDPRVGSAVLTSREDYIVSLIFNTELTDLEEEALNNLVVEYVGKTLAVEALDIGIEFWMVQSQTVTTHGPYEVANFPVSLEHLKERKASLQADLARLFPLVSPLIPNILDRTSTNRPLISSIDDDLLTPAPQDFGPIYGPKET